MYLKKIKLLLVALIISGTATAQQTPAPKQSQPITIVGATAHIGNGEVIENSLIIFENGQITTVAPVSSTKRSYPGKVIYAEGKHVYPGFIAPNSTLGLVEISAVRPSRDVDELGSMLPHVRSIVAYNATSQIVESTRPNGVLVGQITPRGGRISGTSSIVQFDAWNWQDAVVEKDGGLHINWPASYRRGRWWEGETGIKANENYDDEISELRNYFKNARAYLQGPMTEPNLPFEAMESVFSGEKTIYVHVDGEKEIIDLIDFKKDLGLGKVVIVGGAKAHKVADMLRENDIAVLVGRVHDLPNHEDSDYDLPYKLPRILNEKGVLVGLENSGDMERIHTRNLPFYAGTLVAHGVGKEEALKMITSNTAKILGIDDILGTLEVGKNATLFISEGDALDMRTNSLTNAFIKGREISLKTHQTELAKKYRKRYGILDEAEE